MKYDVIVDKENKNPIPPLMKIIVMQGFIKRLARSSNQTHFH